MANGGDGYQKLHSIEKSIIGGDVQGADHVLKTISDKTDQAIFKSLITSHCDSTANYGLPACTLETDGLHFAGAKKMTLTDTNGQLGMRNDEPSIADRARSAFASFSDASSRAFHSVKDSAGIVGDAIQRGGTSDSETNRRWNAQIQKSGG
jgi:hypothetical protein